METKETLYRYALENLNHLHDGDEVFESVCHEVVKYSLPSYQFTKPSGGNGPRDGGRDGFDANKNCRMACAIRVDYEKKLDEEIAKCKQESELFFFSNQKIPETKKIKLEEKYKSKIKLKIFSWADLAETITKIPNTLEFKKVRVIIDDLLDIQKRTFDFDCENFKIHPQKVECEGNVYKSKIIIEQEGFSHKSTIYGKNPLIDFFDIYFRNNSFSSVPNCFVKGVFGIGKTTSVKLLHNSFLNEKNKNWAKTFIPLFYSAKNYPESPIKIPSTDNKFICFLDGIDEISDEKQLKLLRSLSDYINSENVRFVLSGRDGGFNSDTNLFFDKNVSIVRMVPYFDPDDSELAQLQNNLRNTPLERMVLLPIFRSVLSKEKNICNLNPKKLYDLVVLAPLEKDCLKYNQSIDCVDSNLRDEFFNNVVNEFSCFCYDAFCQGQSSFSRDEIKKHFSADVLKYIYKSTLLDIDAQSSKPISFHNHFYYEYFVANYLVDKYDVIKSMLIRKEGIDSKNMNILRILFDISSNPLSLCQHIIGRASKLFGFSLLLKAKYALSNKERFDLYVKIYDYFCQKGRLIYYVTLSGQKTCLKDIDSLAGELYELLPECYYTNAVEILLNDIRKNIKPFNKSRVVRISNAIVLLGVWHGKIWNQEQKEKIKADSLGILSFLLENKKESHILNEFLSETIVLDWYKTYGWTKKWTVKEWNDFLKQVFPSTRGFGVFENYEEFYFQLEIFNDFADDDYVKRFAKPLCIEVMKRQCSERHQADIIPDEIDDNYETPYIHTDSEINSFIYFLETGDHLSADDVVDIIESLIKAHVNFHSTNYEFGKLKKLIFKIWENKGSFVSIDKTEKIYEIISHAMTKQVELPFYEIQPCLNVLPDYIKQTLLNTIIQQKKALTWRQDWFFWSLVTLLLDISDETLVVENLERVRNNIVAENDSSLLLKIYNTVENSRPLYKAVKPECDIKFATKKIEDQKRESLLAKIEKTHNEKLSQESVLFLGPSKIIEEINTIEDFFKNNCTNGRPDYDFLDLDYDTIKNNISNEINFKCRHTPIFSDFVVKFLQPFERNTPFTEWFENARSVIKKCFSDDNNFWIGFYDCYVRSHSDEEVKEFLKENKEVKKKIIDSMAIGVCDFQKELSIQQIISLNYPIWITPLIKYIQLIFNDKIPEYVDKDKLLKIVAYPAKYLVTQTSLFKNQPPWGNYNSAFDWLQKVAGFEYSEIVDKALEIYPQTENLYVKMQLLSNLIEHLDCHERKIANIVLEETRRVFAKPEKFNSGSDFRYEPLPKFWQKADKKYLAEIIDEIPFEKYELRNENPCLRDVIEYALKYMSVEQKEKLIAKYEDSEDRKIRELMRRLGSKKEILRKITEYLNGGKCESYFRYGNANLFGFVKKNIRVLWAYWRLFDYSMEKSSERRSALASVATKGIKEHIDSRLFKIFKFLMNRKIRQRIKAGLYVDWLYDFMDEVEQKVYSR